MCMHITHSKFKNYCIPHLHINCYTMQDTSIALLLSLSDSTRGRQEKVHSLVMVMDSVGYNMCRTGLIRLF